MRIQKLSGMMIVAALVLVLALPTQAAPAATGPVNQTTTAAPDSAASATPEGNNTTEPQPVAEGIITAGVFGASIVWVGLTGQPLPAAAEGTYGFSHPLPPLPNQTVSARVTDYTGAGYFVEFWFNDEHGRHLESDCDDAAGSNGILEQPFGYHRIQPECEVPHGATEIVVTAHSGARLFVAVFAS